MRKGGMTARVAAAILAAAMVMTDVVPAFAAENVTVETTDKGAVSGVSRIIGLEGKYSSNTMRSDDGQVEKDYAYVNPALRYDSVLVTGTKETLLDAATGLYKKGDVYYAYFDEDNSTLSGKVAKVYPGTSQPPQQDATGFYVVDGKKYDSCYEKRPVIKDEYGNETTDWDKPVLSYYFLERDEVEILGAIPGGPFASYDAMWSAVEAAYGQKVAAADTSASYYLANGKTYRAITINYDNNGKWDETTGEYVYSYTGTAYAKKSAEISFDRKYHNISWNEVTNETEVESGGKLLKVGYQVKVDGQAVELGDLAVSQDKKTVEPIQTANSYNSSSSKSYTAAEKAKYEVRAVYYTETVVASDEYADDYYYYGTRAISKQIVKTGDWSEFTYNWSQKQVNVPVVTGLKWVQKNAKKARISWNAVPDASKYKIQSYKSADPVNVATLKEDDWEEEGSTGTRTYYDRNNADLGRLPVLDENGNYTYDADGNQIYKEVNYIYFRVCAVVIDDNENEVEGAYCAPCAVTANRNTNAPVVTGLKVENNDNGTFRLVWKPVDVNANVMVLYSKSDKIFQSQEYTYLYRNATGKDSLGRTQKLTAINALKDKMELADKQLKDYDVPAGQNYISSRDLELEPGKKYYFAVLTYDTSKHDDIRTALTTQTVMVNGKAESVQFVNYNDVSVSARVSATLGLGIDVPSTKSGKKSITMIFGRNDAVTGYEIYRKSGKKYKKVKTVSSTEYTDEGLKESTVYDYRARAYYYNPETKAKKVYSDYVYFSAETGNSNYIDLRVTKKSKTSATLKWTKVSGATQYDIYRAYLTSTDTNLSKSNGFGNYAKQQSNQKFELVKTIKKAKTVSWTDKKLKKDTSYTYVVVASYKSKKVTKQIYATDTVIMKVETPKNVKTSVSGTNVKVTWDKDKFATKYEVSYKKYDNKYYDGDNDAYYGGYEDHWTVKEVKKNSYTIKNVAGNEYVVIRVRAYGSKKWSAPVEVSQEGNEKLKVAQSVKVKEVTEKDAKGVKSTAVKISWKKVSGAKYYKVWRSTSPASFYNADKKSYETNGRVEAIAKESNNDESTSANVVLYKEYKAQNNTIVATSAIDRGNLRTGVTYYYYVQAFGENGDTISGYSKPASICYKVSPSIKKLTAKKGKVTIKINKVNGASKYEIYRSLKKSKGFEKIGTTKKNSTSFVDKKVKKGKKYYYKVVAVGTNGLKADFASGASAVKSIKAK
ncbi:MAG: fibronectin type III domain-containing protein [Lachnospiraceae bacterium]|nr:fibronectin type III domain-containing protein [Lachnospiraceae bacterium]